MYEVISRGQQTKFTSLRAAKTWFASCEKASLWKEGSEGMELLASK